MSVILCTAATFAKKNSCLVAGIISFDTAGLPLLIFRIYCPKILTLISVTLSHINNVASSKLQWRIWSCYQQINQIHLYASYLYQSMTFHFDQDDVVLKAFIVYFQGLSDESRKQAQELMEYQNLRGGRIVFQNIMSPKV